MRIVIHIQAKVIVEIDDDLTPTEKTVSKAPSSQETGKGLYDPKYAKKSPRKGLKTLKRPYPANRVNSKPRSDRGANHHCSRCGAIGRRILARLNGRCKDCQYIEDVML